MEGLGRGRGRPAGGDGAGATDTRFSANAGFGHRISRTCCLVSSLDGNPLIPRRSQLTSVGSPARYLILNPG